MRVHEFTLNSDEWGEVKLLRPIPHGKDGDRWGDLAVLKGTPWGDLIPTVSGADMSHALHGRITPLMRVIGNPPVAQLRLVPAQSRRCADYKTCAMSGETCQPHPKMPECYVPPGLSFEAQMAAQTVVLAWKEGRYVVVVGEGEFSFG
jgi:hypothetical protein